MGLHLGENVELHLGDCLDVLRDMPDNSVDAVVTDPPYNVGFSYNIVDDRKTNYQAWCSEWFKELKRICNGATCISCGHVNISMWCAIEPPKWVLCWWKPAAMGRSPVGFCNWEPMILYGTSKNRAGCDVVRATIKPDKMLDGHPCPKPIDWGVGFVNLLSKPGDTVLDPFMGSGTTGVACVQTGRNFIGIEIDPTYYAIAEKRIREAQMQPTLEGLR